MRLTDNKRLLEEKDIMDRLSEVFNKRYTLNPTPRFARVYDDTCVVPDKVMQCVVSIESSTSRYYIMVVFDSNSLTSQMSHILESHTKTYKVVHNKSDLVGVHHIGEFINYLTSKTVDTARSSIDETIRSVTKYLQEKLQMSKDVWSNLVATHIVTLDEFNDYWEKKLKEY